MLKIKIRIWRRAMLAILNGVIVSRQNCIYCLYKYKKKTIQTFGLHQ